MKESKNVEKLEDRMRAKTGMGVSDGLGCASAAEQGGHVRRCNSFVSVFPKS